MIDHAKRLREIHEWLADPDDFKILVKRIAFEAAGEIDRLQAKLARCEAALKLAYRKLALDDPDVGSNEAEETICNSLCEVMGDEGFQAWMVLMNGQDDGDEGGGLGD